ncbi:hypothetical protein LguiA_003315 [Lonicera macranthoides]
MLWQQRYPIKNFGFDRGVKLLLSLISGNRKFRNKKMCCVVDVVFSIFFFFFFDNHGYRGPTPTNPMRPWLLDRETPPVAQERFHAAGNRT